MTSPDAFDDRLLADLAAAADGTLDPARAAEIETLAAHDDVLAEALERQRRAAAMIRDSVEDVRAPDALRERLERWRDER
jgi:anti-sigma factor RsiW